MKRSSSPAAEVRSRHLPVLRALDGSGNISQRTIAEKIGMAASGVNRLIRELLESGHLEVVDESVRPFAYRLTGDGEGYLLRLIHEHYQTVVEDFRRMQGRISRRLREIQGAGVRSLIFYGAGDVMEVSVPLAEELGLEVVGAVDDDPAKIGTRWAGVQVRSPDCLREMDSDAVVIASYRHSGEIEDRLDGGLPSGARVLQL